MSNESHFSVMDPRTGKPIRTVMQDLRLSGRVLPIGAVLGVRHVFACRGRRPQELIYAFGLPREAALRRFRVTTGDHQIDSDLCPAEEAERLYEEGIEAGHLSTMVREYRDGIVNLNLGNIRPGEPVTVMLELVAGVEATDRGIRFRFPFTLAPGYHPKATTEMVDPETGRILLPEDLFGDVVLPEWRRDARSLHTVGFALELDMPGAIRELSSPSHAIRVESGEPGQARVALAPEADVPDRDLVLDVRLDEAVPRVFGGAPTSGRAHCAVVTPSAAFRTSRDGRKPTPRRIVFVLDRSGSMSGPPMEQAKRAVAACLGALSAEDRFSIVAFDSACEIFRRSLVPADNSVRTKARHFLDRIEARGGTELAAAVAAAAEIFDEPGGEILLCTDGQVFGTEDIVATAETIGVRVHCLGIGSAGADRFLAQIARRTGGLSRSVTPRERVDAAALELFGAISAPVAHKVRVTAIGCGDDARIRPAPDNTVFKNRPLTVFVDFPAGEGAVPRSLQIAWRRSPRGRLQTMNIPLESTALDLGEAVRLLQGARLIAELESLWTSEVQGHAGRRERRLRKMLENASREFGLASRVMSLVAVLKRSGDVAGDLPETRIIPVGLPQDVSFDAYFQASLSPIHGASRVCAAWAGPPPGAPMVREPSSAPSFREETDNMLEESADSSFDRLLDFSMQIQPDGGMPGANAAERLLATCLALLAFLGAESTAERGPFQEHVRRLLAFLEQNRTSIPAPEIRTCIQAVIRTVETGAAPKGEPWLDLLDAVLGGGAAESPRELWQRIQNPLKPALDSPL